MQAATKGQFALVQFLTEDCGADVNAIDEDGATILMKAAVEGHTDVVWYLARERKADVNIRDESGSSALLKAATGGQIDVIRCLARECEADVNETDACGRTLLMKAAAEKLLEVCRCLATECGANVDATDKSGSTALMQAAGKGDITLVQFLVTKCGADVNAAGENGETAIIQAAGRGDIDVVQCLLVQCGACLNAADKSGVTALMKATTQGHVGIVRFLGESGANINATNNNGYSALRIAGEQNDVEMQRVLTQFLMMTPSDYKENRAMNTASKVPTLSEPSWWIPPSEIELLNFVKIGNVGGEYRAKWLDTDVAVKLFIPGTSCHIMFEDEVRLWHQLRHPNVIKLYGACDASPLPLQLLVCEYASSGSLHEYVKATPPKQQKVWSFLHQAALGLEYLHQRGIVHGDLRCSNILIGSDGLSKLVNFGRSDAKDARGLNVSSIRWQAPEVLEGKAPSFTSDVYSLGMCILEAVTKEVPWKNWKVENIRDIKKQWDPDAIGTESWEPLRPHYAAACKLVWSMCCQDPGKRASLSSAVFELERFVIKENLHPKEVLSTIEDYRYGETNELWMTLQMHAEKVDDYLYHQGFTELQKVYECLQKSTRPTSVFQRFHTLLRDFRQITAVPSEQAQVLQLSSTCATNSSFVAFFRRLRSLWSTLGESAEVSREREASWEKQRKKRVEIFVSEVSKGYLIVEELKTQEERNEFLTSLKLQIEHPSAKYTPGQLDILKEAYEDIARKFDSTVACKLTPEWFIPWYELVIDNYDTLGSGGYGSVFRAKWLDSEVVVKRLGGFGVEDDSFSSLSPCASFIPPATAVSTTKRSELMATFLREVDIWFGFSHPHVVRLFGACHVGRPFFVCEYATNGTLVRYLRKHPHDLWQKLHETALGVQYLHARGVVHGDLKGNNIVIGSDKKAKVTDFGLSINANDVSDPQISGASHWVAPECFIREDSRPTFASDIYSLGMCIVEALRVVEAGDDRMKACLPWGSLENSVVKHHVRQGKLPSPSPLICQGKQWELVQRMCAFEPEKRLKISTVVDELEKLAYTRTKSLASTVRAVGIKAIPAAITAMQALLQQLQDGTRKGDPVIPLYVAMWDQLEQVYNQIGGQVNSDGRTTFCSLVDEAGENTKRLEDLTGSLVSFAETTLRCYALRRRLDKFSEAYSLMPPCQKRACSTPGSSPAKKLCL